MSNDHSGILKFLYSAQLLQNQRTKAGNGVNKAAVMTHIATIVYSKQAYSVT